MITILNQEQIKELSLEENLWRQEVLRDELNEQIKNKLYGIDDDGDGEGLEREIDEAILQQDGDESKRIDRKELEEQYEEYSDLIGKAGSLYANDIIKYYGSEETAQQIFYELRQIINEWWNLKRELTNLRQQAQIQQSENK